MSMVVWFTGLSGSGKTTIAEAAHRQVVARKPVGLLDGDVLRAGLCRGLGFTPEGRRESLRRAAEAAKLIADTGALVLGAFITPTKADRELIASIIVPTHQLRWVYVATPLAACEARDVKGHYRRARSGELHDFTGISAPFEPLPDADVVIDTASVGLEEAVARVISLVGADDSLG